MQNIFWILFFNYFTVQVVIGLRTFTKTFEFPDGKGQQWFYLYNSHHFLSRVCEQNEEKTERKCTFKLERNVFNETSETLGTCTTTLRTNLNTKFDYLYHFNVYDNDKVLGVWYNRNKSYKTKKTHPEGYARFVIIQFPKCNSTDISIPFSHDEYNWYKYEFLMQPVILRKNGFDIAYRNSTKCGDKYCKINYNFKANRISLTETWYSPLYNPTYNREYMMLPDDKGFVVSEVYRMHIYYYIVRPDGSKIMLKDMESNPGIYKPSSKSFKGILICNVDINNTTLTCSEFDFDGKPTMEVSFNLGLNNRDSKFIYLSNGGFLLMTSNCWPTPDCDSDGKSESHYVTKINEFGKRVGIIKIPNQDFGKNCTVKADGLYRVGVDEYCLLWMYRCDDENFERKINAFAKCFKDDDFS